MNSNWANNANAREAALGCLIDIVSKGRSLSELQSQLNQHEHSALIREMVFGVCRWFYYFADVSKSLLKKPLRKKDTDVLLIVYLGMYQLQFMQTSDHAAVHETVNLVNKIRKKWAKGLVNALLRKFSQMEFDETLMSYHGVSFSAWMKKMIEVDWPEQAPSLFQYANEKAAISLRINTQKTTIADFMKQLDACNVGYQLDESLAQNITLTQAQNVVELPGFEQGDFYVQDGSAQMASQLLDVKKGMRVLDACAAPGGKTSHIAELANALDIVAIEKEPKRIDRLKENMQRLGHDINVICADAIETKDWFDGKQFDRILLDAPCSASGIIRRHPDIKILRREDDIAELVAIQGSMLKALWPLLKQGGELLYCTCSIFKQENEQQIEAFVVQQTDCAEVAIPCFDWAEQRPRGLQVLPSAHGKDGFYYAKLRKQDV